eukprot:CAMPEP_0119490750 /NCGR_PEP_ID=MMETSP1344-20130328/15830_1 /TAXON_ID=236787 /ORGANISM="Florenciella parvula, Strain CCMP2471" /LENGTH=158 /DNA_ID=CAMNT_0007525945 /DNA_START=16 /DNA_END=489 /DNA_ORIENTATION=-
MATLFDGLTKQYNAPPFCLTHGFALGQVTPPPQRFFALEFMHDACTRIQPKVLHVVAPPPCPQPLRFHLPSVQVATARSAALKSTALESGTLLNLFRRCLVLTLGCLVIQRLMLSIMLAHHFTSGSSEAEEEVAEEEEEEEEPSAELRLCPRVLPPKT